MKMNRNRSLTKWVLVAVLTLSTAACQTVEYRQVQSDFEAAVRADGDNQTNPIIDRSEELYRDVASSLTDERIAGLEPKLRANAWMIRSYSEWRSAQLGAARESAGQGLAANPVAHSRDDVLLHLLPALVIDSEIMTNWDHAGSQTDLAAYTSDEKNFQTAMAKVDEAKSRIGPATPASTGYYVEYQRWRIIQNWRAVINGIPESQRDERRAARARAQVAGKTLSDAANESRNVIPKGHFLRQKIIAQGG